MEHLTAVSPGWFTLAWQIAVALFGCAGSCVGMWATLKFARRAEVEALKRGYDEAFARQDQRLTRIEEQLRQAPKHTDLVAVSGTINELSGRVARMEGEQARNNNLLQAIHDHLLNEK